MPATDRKHRRHENFSSDQNFPTERMGYFDMEIGQDILNIIIKLYTKEISCDELGKWRPRMAMVFDIFGFPFFMIAIFSIIQKNEKFADLRENNKFRDPYYSVLIFAIFVNRENPLGKSGILFSKIVLLFQVLFTFIPAFVAIFIEKNSFSGALKFFR